MFPSPTGGKDPGQGVSLLFTPKPADAQKTPDWTVRGQSFQVGRSPTTGTARSWEATPPSRRRSMTPASGTAAARDTTPPPPMDSLLDSPAAALPAATTSAPPGPGFAGWAAGQDHDDHSGAPFPSTSSPMAAAFKARQQQHKDFAQAAKSIERYEDTWITVFGITQSDIPLVLREFSKCGDIHEFGTFGESSTVNWLHISFATNHGAQRALLRNGERLSQFCMVGVKPLDPAQKAGIDRYMAGGTGGVGTVGGGVLGGTGTDSSNNNGGGAFLLPFPKPAQNRGGYALDASSGSQAVVPLCNKSTWAKVSEFVLGL